MMWSKVPMSHWFQFLYIFSRRIWPTLSSFGYCRCVTVISNWSAAKQALLPEVRVEAGFWSDVVRNLLDEKVAPRAIVTAKTNNGVSIECIKAAFIEMTSHIHIQNAKPQAKSIYIGFTLVVELRHNNRSGLKPACSPRSWVCLCVRASLCERIFAIDCGQQPQTITHWAQTIPHWAQAIPHSALD